MLNFDNMRDLGMPDLHGNGGQSFSYVADPVVTPQCSECLGDGFVEDSAVTSIAWASRSDRGQRRYRP